MALPISVVIPVGPNEAGLDNLIASLDGLPKRSEVFLAREAQLCYATVCISTDYDCWMEDPSQHVTVQQVIERFGGSLAKAKKLLLALMEKPAAEIDEGYRRALDMAVLTPDEALNAEQLEMLSVLRD